MSLAVCIKCGSRKISAWTECEVCGCRNVDIEDLARSIYLSDSCRRPKELKDASREIKQGNFTFPDQQLARIKSPDGQRTTNSLAHRSSSIPARPKDAPFRDQKNRGLRW